MTWYAGNNSTNGGSLGWDFTAFAPSGVTGVMAATEAGADVAAASGAVLVSGAFAATEAQDTAAASGNVYVQGELAATETGQDTASAAGKVLVTGAMAATETAPDTLSASGSVRVRGSGAAVEIGQDTASATGRVIVRGSLAAIEVGADTASATGKIIVKGLFAALETGQDSFASSGKVYINGGFAATESSDIVGCSGTVSSGFAITGAQALLLYKIYQLHGLKSALTVSGTTRSVGDIVQAVNDTGSTVTISTSQFGSDTLSGLVGLMIEELAALHGIGQTLSVTDTTRAAGSISQSITTAGGATTVQRL